MNRAPQNVSRTRRHYNQWVANQTLEDYALRFTAKSSRRWSLTKVALTAIGSISFLALEAIGGTLTLSHGFNSAIAAIVIVSIIIFLTGIPISYYSAKHGIDIDLLTRGAGFGYLGSTLTSLIYASFTFIFFALEASILALALELTLGMSVSLGYIVSSLVIIPIVTHGITLISRFQVWSQPIWLALQILPLVLIAVQYDDALTLWVNFSPDKVSEYNGATFSLLAFGASASVLFSLIAQIGEQVDFLRFLPSQSGSPKKWWTAVLAAGPGWIIVGCIKMLIGSFLAVLCIEYGFSSDQAEDPNYMYMLAFSYVTNSEQLSLILLGVFVVISQLKINVTNAYAGSIAWSNFFSRLTYSHPGRVVWLVFNVIIAILLMELGVFRVLEGILGGFSIVALSWVGSLVADLVISKPLGLRPSRMEFKRAYLYDLNPVGIGSMLGSASLGFICYSGVLGEVLHSLSSFITLFSTLILAPLIAWLTKGKYYIARPEVIFDSSEDITCSVCNHSFEQEDMTICPAYSGNICSLCCSLDARCGDMCKTNSRFSEQILAIADTFLPTKFIRLMSSRFGHFLGLFVLNSLVVFGVLFFVYSQITMRNDSLPSNNDTVFLALTNAFIILIIIFGVVSWMLSLSRDSRIREQEETKKQTALLQMEILAHSKTGLELKIAKEHAESANLAKSRYLTGISHELRSPLNAIMGYAQLLENATDIPESRYDALTTIRRSSEHLTDIIEGLLDISSIEAGVLYIENSNTHLNDLLNQLVSMFTMQAKNKNITFSYVKKTPIPNTVKADQKRLRQVLINILSNAIKYTESGSVTFTVSYRNQVAHFSVKDTGQGIESTAIQDIFLPFTRIIKPEQPFVSGTGLGLTITRLLVDVMGGEIKVTSVPNQGSEFVISLMLSNIDFMGKSEPSPSKKITGYRGETKTIFVVDDDPIHRNLIKELFEPIGFSILMSDNGNTCLRMLSQCQTPPDIFLLDVSMPGLSGWQLAETIRATNPYVTIIMTSANVDMNSPLTPNPSNGYLIKPLKHSDLFSTIQTLTDISWLYSEKNTGTHIDSNALTKTKEHPKRQVDTLGSQIKELINLSKIGHASELVRRINALLADSKTLSAMDKKNPIGPQEKILNLENSLKECLSLAKRYQFEKLILKLEDLI